MIAFAHAAPHSIAIALLMAVLPAQRASANAGDLDPTFGMAGS